MAKKYIELAIIPKGKIEDAIHIAYSTIYEFDILLSWNFKHLANVNKQKLINDINYDLGFTKTLLLVNPYEVVYDK